MTINTLNEISVDSVVNRQHVVRVHAVTGDAAWKGLFMVGGIAALIAALVFRRNLAAELMLLRGVGIINVGPTTPPGSVMDWFALLQNSPLLGLTLLDLFDMVNYALVGVMLLALCVALRRVNPSGVVIAAALGFVGIVVYFASNQALSMLSLSDQYAAATTDVQRSLFLAAGQATLALHQNVTYKGTGIYLSFFLVTVAGLIIAAVMLRSNIFSRGTAYMGILANGLGLAYYVILAIAPALVVIPVSASAPFLLIWYVLIGRRLLRLAKVASSEEEQTARAVKEK